MPRKRVPPPDDPEQSNRLIAMARKIGVDESDGAFERAFSKVARVRKPAKKSETRVRTSDKSR